MKDPQFTLIAIAVSEAWGYLVPQLFAAWHWEWEVSEIGDATRVLRLP